MRILIMSMLGLTLTACETVQTTQPVVVGVNRQPTMLVSDQELTQAPAQEYPTGIADAPAQFKLDLTSPYPPRRRTVFSRLLPETPCCRPAPRRYPPPGLRCPLPGLREPATGWSACRPAAPWLRTERPLGRRARRSTTP